MSTTSPNDPAASPETPAPGRAGHYGVDAPYVPAMFLVGGVAFLILGIVTGPAPVLHAIALIFFIEAAIYLHTTARGKFVAWERLLDGLGLSGGEEVADLGCGRGAVLLTAAGAVEVSRRGLGPGVWFGGPWVAGSVVTATKPA